MRLAIPRTRLDERPAVRGMRRPRTAHISRDHHHAATLAIVPAVEHEHARLDLCHLRLGGIIKSARSHVPSFAVVLGKDNCRVW